MIKKLEEGKIMVIENILKEHAECLDDKKMQTSYKIQYVTNYVKKWLYVVVNVPENKKINFIDAMCNAGIYKDGDFGTAIKVLELFNEVAVFHPDKVFNLILNDKSEERLEIIKKVIDFVGIKAKNINIVTKNKDVNDFLQDELFFVKYFKCYSSRSANLMFVDPYNFCTVKISCLQKFLSQWYCELIYNIFTSDYVRNQDKPKMIEYCSSEKIDAIAKEDMVEIVKSKLKIGYVKYCFSYEFKTKKNNEIYQIMFFTPNSKGLIKLKEALWDTFNGAEFHKNKESSDSWQISLFSKDDDRDIMKLHHATIAQDLLLKKFKGFTVDYKTLELFIIENTILYDGQIIENVLKPLIKQGKIIKIGKVKKANNYKSDEYKIN